MIFKQYTKHICLSLLIFANACSTGHMGQMGQTGYPTDPQYPSSQKNAAILDLQNIPQDIQVYAQMLPNEPIISAKEQAKEWQDFQRLFFAPWTITKSSLKYEDLVYTFKLKGYSENLQAWEEESLDAVHYNANMESFPSQFTAAISVRSTPLRELPTTKPRFANPNLAGQGYPFDLTQYASLPIATPLRIIHQTRDKAWVYVETALVSGWLQAQDVAELSQEQIKNYMQYSLVAVINENVPLITAKSTYLATANIGTILARDSKNNILLPSRNAQGQASFSIAQNTPFVTPIPQIMSPNNVATIANLLNKQNYGWGGLYENRDCSSMLRDLMTPFGIWLPRNSAAQAKAWEYYDFSKQSTKQKLDTISKNGKPFRTLLWLQGHITLYLGTYNNTPIIFHNIWGLRTIDGKNEGRHIIGKAIVSSTELGKELKNIKPNSTLIERMQGMSILE